MTTDPRTERFDTVIIGAGQAGLSAGYHLARRGMRFVILESNARVGDNWRSRWQSLRLYSPAWADGLPGMPFPAAKGHFPSGLEMADYLESYVRDLALPVRTGVRVDRMRRRDDGREGFVVDTSDGRFEATQVIVATGAFRSPLVPEMAAQLDPSIHQLHSSEYRGPWQLRDGPVLVVGASHSGADVALEASKGHRTYLSGAIHGQLPVPLESRRGRIGFRFMLLFAKHVATLRTPIGRRMAPLVRMGGGPLLRVRRQDLDRAGVERFDARTEGVTGGKPTLADGRVLDVTNVIWCTGFRPDFDWIELPITDDDGWPIQRRGVVSSAPGLYFLGLPFLYAFSSMLVAGAGRDAAYVADRVAAFASIPRSAGDRGSTAAPSPVG
jgi:putative flavoprotein involved in K+ transport